MRVLEKKKGGKKGTCAPAAMERNFSAGVADYSEVDILSRRYKFVNFEQLHHSSNAAKFLDGLFCN